MRSHLRMSPPARSQNGGHDSARCGPALLVLLCLGLSGCGPSPDSSTAPSPAPGAQRLQANHSPLFKDISRQVGLNFHHDSGAKGQYFMPEQAGSGVALFDYDNDGRLDVYLIQCGGPQSNSKNQLYHQETDGTLKNVSEGSGLDVVGYGMGATAGDINNDGLTDMLVTEYGATRLFLNRGLGKFQEITAESGLANAHWATAASWVDYDRDGWLDLVVGNYLDYNPTHKCQDAKGAPEYCGPQNFEGTVARLFHNETGTSPDRKVRLTDVTVPSGFIKAKGPALGIICADFNGDRWPDIFIADDGQPNRLFVNQKDGTFRDEAKLRGVAFNAMGSTAGNMGVTVGDVNGDGMFDLFVTHLATEQHALWTQNPRGLFLDQTSAAGLSNPAWRGTGFGTTLADFNQDGWLDLAFVNGLVRRGPGSTAGARVDGLDPFWSPYAQRYQLFLNDGAGKMVDVSPDNPDFSGRAAVGRGLACGDFNNDGKLDLLSTSTGGPAQLFENVAGHPGHWLMIRAVDPAVGARDAYGAEITVVAGGKSIWRLLQPAFSYLSSHDPRIHFGLGSAPAFEAITVVWPDGSKELFQGGAADRLIELRKGTGQAP